MKKPNLALALAVASAVGLGAGCDRPEGEPDFPKPEMPSGPTDVLPIPPPAEIDNEFSIHYSGKGQCGDDPEETWEGYSIADVVQQRDRKLDILPKTWFANDIWYYDVKQNDDSSIERADEAIMWVWGLKLKVKRDIRGYAEGEKGFASPDVIRFTHHFEFGYMDNDDNYYPYCVEDTKIVGHRRFDRWRGGKRKDFDGQWKARQTVLNDTWDLTRERNLTLDTVDQTWYEGDEAAHVFDILGTRNTFKNVFLYPDGTVDVLIEYPFNTYALKGEMDERELDVDYDSTIFDPFSTLPVCAIDGDMDGDGIADPEDIAPKDTCTLSLEECVELEGEGDGVEDCALLRNLQINYHSTRPRFEPHVAGSPSPFEGAYNAEFAIVETDCYDELTTHNYIVNVFPADGGDPDNKGRLKIWIHGLKDATPLFYPNADGTFEIEDFSRRTASYRHKYYVSDAEFYSEDGRVNGDNVRMTIHIDTYDKYNGQFLCESTYEIDGKKRFETPFPRLYILTDTEQEASDGQPSLIVQNHATRWPVVFTKDANLKETGAYEGEIDDPFGYEMPEMEGFKR
jgi:hypothetical protein